jgi:MFS family permease
MAKDLNGFLWDSGFSAGSMFLLCMILVQPLFSEISSTAGRKPALVLSLVLLIIGTGACASAESPGVLLFGIIMQGAGSGGLEPVKLHVLYDLFDSRARSAYIAPMHIPWALGTLARCLFVPLFTHNLSTWVGITSLFRFVLIAEEANCGCREYSSG